MHTQNTSTMSKSFCYLHLFFSVPGDEKITGACDLYEYDEDGDLIVKRVHTEDSKELVITVGKNCMGLSLLSQNANVLF